MIEQTYKLKLEIARIAYKEIKAVIDKYEREGFFIHAHWDECITVDDILFHGHELKEE